MTNLTAISEWTSVYQLEKNDNATAGPNGLMNSQAQSLLNRTEYLKQQIEVSKTGVKFFSTKVKLDAFIPGEDDPKQAFVFETQKYYIWEEENVWKDQGSNTLDQAKLFAIQANNIENKFQFRDFQIYKSEVTIPLYTDKNNNVIFGYNKHNDELYGNGLIDQKLMHSMHINKNPQNLPILTDKNNNVIFGYNPNNDELYGNGLIDPKLLHSMHINKNTKIYPILVDSNNNVIFGYDAENDKLIGLTSESSSSACVDIPLPFSMISKSVNMMIGYGQSLSTGVGSNVVLSTTQPFYNITFGSGVRGNGGDFSSQKPLVEDNVKPTPDGETNAGETICSGSANYASLSAYKENGVTPSDHVIFSSTAGHGNYQISQLSKGTDWYNLQFMGHLNGAKALNPNIVLHAVNWLQGEADSAGDQTTHYNALIQLQKDIEADAKAITSQTSPTLFFVYQHSTFIYKRPAVALALLKACQTSDKFYFIAPTFAFPAAADNIHLSAIAYKWLGAYYGRAYKQAVHDKIKPRSIMPKGAVINGTKIRIKFNVPHKPLVLDTTNLANTTQYGFAVFDGSTEVLINSVYVENGDEVVLELSRTTNSTVTVNYAIDYLASSLNLFKGASGNLRDSCTETVMINNESKPMFYICPHFSLTVISEII